MTVQQSDELEALLRGLPPDIGQRVRALDGLTGLLEIVMDLGRLPEARFTGREDTLAQREVSAEDLAYVISHIGQFGGDNRAGIERTLHRISALRNRAGKVVGLTLRVGRAVYGTMRSSATSSSPAEASCSSAVRVSVRRRFCARSRESSPTRWASEW